MDNEPPQDAVTPKDPPTITLDKRSASKAAVWTMGYAVISKLVFPLLGVYIARTLGPTKMGAFALLMTIVNFSEVIRDAGLTQTFLADSEMDVDKEGSYLTVAIVTGLIPALILTALATTLAQFFKLPELSWALPMASVVIAMNGVSTIPRAKMLRAGQIKMSGGLDLIGSAIGLGTAIVLVHQGAGFVALVIQLMINATFGLVVSWIRYPVRSIHASLDAFRKVGRKAMAVLAANGINNLFLFADQTVVNKFSGIVNNGYFGQAANLAYKPADLFIFPLTRTLMVAFSQSAVDHLRLARAYARSLSVAIMIVLPIYVFLGLFARPIILLLLGPGYPGSIPALSAMCLYLGFRVLGNISGYALVPAGKHFLTFWPWLAAAALTAGAVALTVGGRGPFPNPSLFLPIVWCFVGGAAFVYLCLLYLGLKYCPPAAPERARLMSSVAALVVSATVMGLFRLAPVSIFVQLGAAAITGPFLHLAILGTIFAKKPLYYLNRNGLRVLWSEL